MVTVAIPKRITKGEELIVIPRKEYERFLSMYKKYRWSEREHEAEEDILRGKMSPAYKTKRELKNALGKLKR